MKKELDMPTWAIPEVGGELEWLLESLAIIDRVTEFGDEVKPWNPMAFISGMSTIIDMWATEQHIDKVEVAQVICKFMEV